jgi:hypothetical protein
VDRISSPLEVDDLSPPAAAERLVRRGSDVALRPTQTPAEL